MTDVSVEVRGLSKKFRLYRERNQSLKAALMRGKRAAFEEFWALKDVSFDIPDGSTYGLIGENGSGKSTLLKCIARILEPDRGEVRTRGRVAALLELGSGFHPELSGRENVFLNGSILGLSRKELERRFDEIVDFAGIGKFIDQPVKNYSSGMYVRLGFAIAINVDPDVLLVDEVLAVGDAAFQEKCMDKFADFRQQGKTVVIVSHAMGSLRSMCDRAVWLEHGTVVKEGRANAIVDGYIDATHDTLVHAAETEEPVRLDVEPQARWGSGEARITRVDLLDHHGRFRDRYRTGDPMTIKLWFAADNRIERPVFGVAVENTDGVYVWSLHSEDNNYRPAYLDGVGSVELSVPALTLQPGTFDLSVSIVDHTTTHVFDFMRNCRRFHMDLGTPRESGGIVTLSATWQNLVAGPSAEAARPVPQISSAIEEGVTNERG